MKTLFVSLIAILLLHGCSAPTSKSATPKVNWEKRSTTIPQKSDLIMGSTYLSVYSQIYQLHEHKTYNLTVTVSLRNVSPQDTVYVLSADYYNSEGELLRKYVNNPIYLKPLETVEIVINEDDEQGGTGGNFVFNWAAQNELQVPFFEAIMVSTTGQQGLSFGTQGIRITD